MVMFFPVRYVKKVVTRPGNTLLVDHPIRSHMFLRVFGPYKISLAQSTSPIDRDDAGLWFSHNLCWSKFVFNDSQCSWLWLVQSTFLQMQIWLFFFPVRLRKKNTLSWWNNMTETQCKRNWLVIVNSSCSVGSDPHFPAGSGWCFANPLAQEFLLGFPWDESNRIWSSAERWVKQLQNNINNINIWSLVYQYHWYIYMVEYHFNIKDGWYQYMIIGISTTCIYCNS